MNKNLKAFLFFIFICCIANAQVASVPEYLSPLDIANWAISGGFIASASAKPTGTASEGNFFIDKTDPLSPELYQYVNGKWVKMAGGGLKEHIASDTDPHGANLKISESISIGDPEAEPFSSIDSPEPGQIRIASYVVLIPLASAPTAVDGAIYKSTDGHFYGCDGTSWLQLDN